MAFYGAVLGPSAANAGNEPSRPEARFLVRVQPTNRFHPVGPSLVRNPDGEDQLRTIGFIIEDSERLGLSGPNPERA